MFCLKSVKKLLVSNFLFHTGTVNYRLGLTNHYGLLRPRTKLGEQSFVTGLAVLGNELFIATGCCPIIEVWNMETLQFKRMWMLQYFQSPIAMKSCFADNCLYLLTEYDGLQHQIEYPSSILRVDPSGNLIVSWRVKGHDRPISHSVTVECNVLVTTSSNMLIEHSREGNVLDTVAISSESSSIESIQHAIKLSADQYLICHGNARSNFHGVCIVDHGGNVLKSFGKVQCNLSLQLLNCPIDMEIDSLGNILVADNKNNRVLVLDSNLEIIAIPLTSSEQHAAQREDDYQYSFRPQLLCFHEAHKTLIVAEEVHSQGNDEDVDTYLNQILSVYRFSH